MAWRSGIGSGGELARRDDPPDEVLDEGLGDRDVHVVVGHLVAHPVGHPAQGQFAQIACPQNDGLMEIGQAEQVGGPLARLHVLERDIVNRLPARKRMADVAEHLEAGRTYIDLSGAHPKGGHEPGRVGAGQVAGGETRHRVGQDILARQPQLVHRLGGNDECLGRIQAAGDADDHALDARVGKPLNEAVDLDVVCLETTLVALQRIAWHVGKPGDVPAERDFFAREPQFKRNAAHRLNPLPAFGQRILKAGHPHPILPQPLEVDVGGDHLLAIGKPLRLRQQIAVLIDQGVSVPGQVGGGFPRPGGGVEIGGDALA